MQKEPLIREQRERRQYRSIAKMEVMAGKHSSAIASSQHRLLDGGGDGTKRRPCRPGVSSNSGFLIEAGEIKPAVCR